NQSISPQVEGVLGYPPAAFETDNTLWPRLIHPDDRERALAEIEQAQQAIGPFTSEYRLIARDGRIVWVRDESVAVRDADGKPKALNGLIFDITQQKLAEEALVESEARFREMLQNARLLAVIVDENAQITFVNEFLLELTGWTRAEVIGTSWYERFVPPERVAEFEPAFR